MPRSAAPALVSPVPRAADRDRRRTSASVVLRSVLEHGPVARSTVARLTGLSPASVTEHCARLAALGLIRESAAPRRSRGVGRPHVPVELDDARFVVGGVHVAVPYTTVALLDLRGRVLARRELKHRLTEPVLPGIVPVVGSTEAEARAAERVLEDHIVPEHGLKRLERLLQLAPGSLELDRRLPEDLPPESAVEGAKSRYTLVVSLARREQLTVRRLIGRLGGGRGHQTFAGTPEQIADRIETWFTQGAADGFNVMPPVLPSGLDAFVDHVVPVLRARGLFREEYGPRRTLRERYGLPRPANQYLTPAHG
ncbi:hypothetical protein [Streptomyces misionensis]|uniref:hypothetical protein n=1 Tax=Streptomyces misionensis TaxID=67331 RepID=UPI0033AC8C9A